MRVLIIQILLIVECIGSGCQDSGGNCNHGRCSIQGFCICDEYYSGNTCLEMTADSKQAEFTDKGHITDAGLALIILAWIILLPILLILLFWLIFKWLKMGPYGSHDSTWAAEQEAKIQKEVSQSPRDIATVGVPIKELIDNDRLQEPASIFPNIGQRNERESCNISMELMEERKDNMILDLTNNELSEGELDKVEVEDALGREISMDSEPIGKDVVRSNNPDKAPKSDAEIAQEAHLNLPEGDAELYSISDIAEDEDFS